MWVEEEEEEEGGAAKTIHLKNKSSSFKAKLSPELTPQLENENRKT